MSLKHLLPSFRTRYLFTNRIFSEKLSKKKWPKALNIGTGEGEYDALIAKHCGTLISTDINDEDLDTARNLNKDVSNASYVLEDALDLSFSNKDFDLVMAFEVLEHVGDWEKMLEEMRRVIKDDGYCLMTFPITKFPIIYDPINKLCLKLFKKKFPIGGYAYGHDYLIDYKKYEKKMDELGFEILHKAKLSGPFSLLFEVYWAGMFQKLFKANSGNATKTDKKLTIKPMNRKTPKLAFITDAIIKIDSALFKNYPRSLGRGYLLKCK